MFAPLVEVASGKAGTCKAFIARPYTSNILMLRKLRNDRYC